MQSRNYNELNKREFRNGDARQHDIELAMLAERKSRITPRRMDERKVRRPRQLKMQYAR